MCIQVRLDSTSIPNTKPSCNTGQMNSDFGVKWNNRTAQQLVSYESLFRLIDEIHPLEDILEIAQRVARQWKYFANVAAWRLVIQNDDVYTVIDGVHGKAVIENVEMPSSWDAHFMRSRRPALFSVSDIPDSPSVPEHLVSKKISQIGVIPFVKIESCYALITVAALHEPFTDIDKKFIRLFSSHLTSLIHAILIQKRTTDTLIKKATHDYLTGMLNREAIIERLDIFFRLSKRTGDPLSIVIADIDHFKRINDTYGHPAGDRVLQSVSRILTTQTRDSDHVGRYGGEEFLFVLYPCEANQALQAAERRREAVLNHPVPISENADPVRLTVSFGLSTMTHDDISPDYLIARADAALYEAKNNGRNRCVFQ